MKRVTVLAAVFLCLGLPCRGDRIFTEIGGSRDSDDARSLLVVGGYGAALDESGETNLALGAGQRYVFQAGERERFDLIRVQLDGVVRRNWQLNLGCDLLDGDAWTVALPSLAVTGRPHDDWYLELSAGREMVDTIGAVRNHIRFDSYVASADYRIDSAWTVVGAYLHQRFSDGNRRDGGIGRVIFTPSRFPGLHLQLKGRLLDGEQASPDYFSPERLREGFLLFGYATPFAGENWVVKLLTGPGLQSVDPFSGSSRTADAYLGDISLRGWFSDRIRLDSRIGCTWVSGSREAYEYCSGSVTIGLHW